MPNLTTTSIQLTQADKDAIALIQQHLQSDTRRSIPMREAISYALQQFSSTLRSS